MAVAAGALARIFAWVQAAKTKPTYTDTIGTTLRIIGPEDAATHNAPEFKLKLDHQGGQQVVRISFKKFGNPGVAVWSKRAGGAWELVAIVLTSPFTDERPLLTAGTPEVRDYRLQFFDGTSAVGDFSDVASVTVAP
ncbi:MAG: hypothetical protein HY301_09420 [Verrucomicrobia bacterium]|nr:hypothetical protein [Verrucomicrobiota bacterium]